MRTALFAQFIVNSLGVFVGDWTGDGAGESLTAILAWVKKVRAEVLTFWRAEAVVTNLPEEQARRTCRQESKCLVGVRYGNFPLSLSSVRSLVCSRTLDA